MALSRCWHWLGRRLPNGELVRYVRPLTQAEFERLAHLGVAIGFVVWHISESNLKPGSRRLKILLKRRWVRRGLIPVDPIASLKAADPARYRIL